MDQQDIQNKKVNSSESQDKDAGWLSRLKNKWQVGNILQVVLILCTFAIGGSMCGYFGKKLMNLMHLENKFIWAIVYVLLVTILWPLCVLVVSIPFGQFRFFKKYLAKMGRRIAGRKK
jgi:hypothetical protein